MALVADRGFRRSLGTGKSLSFVRHALNVAAMNHGFLVGLFDVLGFEQKLKAIGLAEMRARYETLIAAVNYRKQQIRHVFGDLKFNEAPYWSADGDVFIFNEIHGAYASDSILVWANRTWPQARSIGAPEIEALAKSPANQWAVRRRATIT